MNFQGIETYQDIQQAVRGYFYCTLASTELEGVLTYRTTAHATTGVPPCKLFMQRELRTRLSLLQPDREKSVLDKQSQQKSAHDRRSQFREWTVGDRVMVCNLRPEPDWIPATIAEVLGPVTCIVDTDDGQRWMRHTDQIKN